MNTFNQAIKDTGIQISDSRIENIAKAVNDLHKAICYLDVGNRKIMYQHFPELIAAAKTFGENDFASNSNFNIATQGEIDADELFGGDI